MVRQQVTVLQQASMNRLSTPTTSQLGNPKHGASSIFARSHSQGVYLKTTISKKIYRFFPKNWGWGTPGAAGLCCPNKLKRHIGSDTTKIIALIVGSQ
jgi:hypothetical protein